MESEKQNNKQNKNRLIDTETKLMVDRWEGFGGVGIKVEGRKMYKWAVTKLSRGCKVHYWEYRQ